MTPGAGELVVRAETARDVDATREVVAAAFGDEPVAELLDGLRTSSAWRRNSANHRVSCRWNQHRNRTEKG